MQVGWGNVTFEVGSTGINAQELEAIVHDLVKRALPVTAIWIKPPLQDRRINLRSFDWPGSMGLVRAAKIDEIDLQPCDGLHVRSTEEVGGVALTALSRLPGNMVRAHVRLLDLATTGSSTGA